MSTVTIQGPQEAVTFNGVAVTFSGESVTWASNQASYLRVNTLALSDTLEGRSTASFQTVHLDGVAGFELGQQVTIKSDGVEVFGGIVDDLIEREDSFGRLWLTIKCVDYTALLDRHRVAGAYEGELAGDIVRDILTDATVSTLNEEGLTSVGVEDGPTISRIVFNYVTATQALEELASYSGFHWNVTAGKDVVFRARDASAAPFSITDSSGNYRNLTLRRDKLEYRNRQYVRAGKDLTDARTESFTGDSDTRTWLLAFPVGKVPTITVNAVAKTVGIRGLDTGKDFYWNKGDPSISQDDLGTTLTATDTLAVTYQGLFPILVITENAGAQGERADAEGTSGIYSNVVQDATLDDRDNAVTKAQSLLARFGEFNAGVEFETDEGVEANLMSLQAGDLLTVTKSAHGLAAEECLVESVTWTRRDPATWVARIKALTGNQTMSWLRYWRALAEQQQGLSIRENEVVVLGGESTSFSDTVDFTDVLTPVDAAPENRVGFLQIGFGEIG